MIDTLGRITYSEYDTFGRLIRQTRNYDPNRPQNDEGQYNLVTEYAYDANGNQNRVTDTFDRITYSEYDLLGRLSRQIQNYDPNRPQNDENQYNLITEYQYDALDNQVQVKDPTGRITYKAYDALNRVIRQVQNYDENRAQNDENQYNIVTEYDYDEIGRQYKVTDTYGRVTYNEFNAVGQLIHTTRNYDENRPQNYENRYNIVTAYEYDAAGHQIKEIDTYGKATYYTYDELGRKASKIENYKLECLENDPSVCNLRTDYGYNLAGQQTDETDPNGVVTHFEYDALGRLAASVQNYRPGITPTDEVNLRIAYTYDALGNRLSRMDPRSHSTTYAYDALGRLSGEVTPLLNETLYVYNALGNLVTKTDGNGQVTQYGYDALNRQTLIDYPSGEADVSYTYNLQGQPLTMTDSLGTTTWVYDRLGRTTSVTHPDGSWVAFSYDALGNRLSLTMHLNANDVTGKTISYAYDALNRLVLVTDWDLKQTAYDYDALGRLTATHLPNGVTSTYTYNSAGRLVGVDHSRQSEVLASYQYAYDSAGNRVWASESVQWAGELPAPTQFSAVEQGYLAIALAWPDSNIEEEGYTLERSTDGQYWQPLAELEANTQRYIDYGLLRDTAYWYRLTAHNTGQSEVQTVATMTGWDAVTYEAVELRSRVIDYTYDALHRLKTATYDDGMAFSYTYDAAGNTLQMVKTIEGQTSTTVYTYNEDNQLVTAQKGSETAWQYHFDGNGSLVEVTPGSQAELGAKRYTYNTAGQLVQVEMHDGTSYQPQAEMIYNGQGQRVSVTGYQGGQSLTTAYLLDGQSLLAATANSQSTFYLPGIGEKKQDWSYYLADGTNSVRQMGDGQGAVTLTRSFTPWGELLAQAGEGDFTWGYLGGVLDAATGLVYVGNGQYYDPATGRFLSRGVNPTAPNPYVPWQGNPLGMIVGPFALLAMVRGKRKAGKIDQFLVVLVLLVATSVVLSGLGGGTAPAPSGATPTTPPVNGTPNPTNPGNGGGGGGRAALPPTQNPVTPTLCSPTPGTPSTHGTTPTPVSPTPGTPPITPTPDKLPPTVLDETKLNTTPGGKTGITAVQVYQLYLDMWKTDKELGCWWWVVFGSDKTCY